MPFLCYKLLIFQTENRDIYTAFQIRITHVTQSEAKSRYNVSLKVRLSDPKTAWGGKDSSDSSLRSE